MKILFFKSVFWVVLGIFCFLSVCALASDWGDLAPEPELLEPQGEVVDISGKDGLTFKWSPFIGRLWERQYYDFRLYQGRDRVEANQILVKKVDKNQYSVTVDASQFKDGGVYSWGVKQIYLDKKSEQAYASFQIINKQVP